RQVLRTVVGIEHAARMWLKRHHQADHPRGAGLLNDRGHHSEMAPVQAIEGANGGMHRAKRPRIREPEADGQAHGGKTPAGANRPAASITPQASSRPVSSITR